MIPIEGPGAAAGDLADLESALRDQTGLSLASSLARALHVSFRNAARQLGLGIGELRDRVLAGDARWVGALVDASVIGETYFFRHPEQLEALRDTLFRTAEPARPLSIWSAGCSTGEEPYSIGMALVESGRPAGLDEILATDVSERALGVARAGVYGAWSLRRLDAERRRRFLRETPPAFEVAPELRRMVRLARHNLVKDAPPGSGFDLVLCRNVLIYFDSRTAGEVLRRLVAALRPGGLLVLGPAEIPLAAPLALESSEVGDATLLRNQPTRAALARKQGGDRRRPDPGPAATPVRARAARPGPGNAEVEGDAGGGTPAGERSTGCSAPVKAADELSPELFLLVSMAAEVRGDLPGAVEAARRAVYLDPRSAMGHATLAVLYRRLGHDGEARRARRNGLRALDGLDDDAIVGSGDSITVGALRRALAAGDERLRRRGTGRWSRTDEGAGGGGKEAP